ncbi:MAG: GAF domain-containing protein [Anaerolineae bacterium]|nr:GAF domain-containing protein [Anaerolineae bacterium]
MTQTTQWAHPAEKRRLRVGVVLTWLRDIYESIVLSGIHRTAEALDVDVVCFVGGEIVAALPHNMIYRDLLDPDQFDGLIISSTLAHRATAEALEQFCAGFAPLPIVSGSFQASGVTRVLPDGYSGMKDLVDHLIDVHGYRRIAFIRGPVGQEEAEDRYRAYLDALLQHEISLDEALVVTGDYRRFTGAAAVEQLLARGVEFDAVAAANDEMAVGAKSVLEAHGLQVPEDVALTGFDDVESGRVLDVPLTTVRQQFDLVFREMLLTLIRRIQGEDVPQRIHVPTVPVIRRSCGCSPVVPIDVLPEDALGDGEVIPPGISEVLWDTFVTAIQGGEAEEGAFLQLWEVSLRAYHEQPIDLEGQRDVLTQLERQAQARFDTRDFQKVQVLLCRAQVLTYEALSRAQGHARLQSRQHAWALQQFESTAFGVVDLADLAEVVVDYFPVLSVDRCYMALFTGEDATHEARLVLTFHEGRAGAAVSREVFPSRQLLPPDAFPSDRFTFVVYPLILRERVMGFLVLSYGNPDGALYDRLAEQFSGNVFRVLLVEQQTEARKEIEAARQRAEVALRDLMVLQRRYVREAWEGFRGSVKGYLISPDMSGPNDDSWLPVMSQALQEGSLVVAEHPQGGCSLGLPIKLHGEVMGALGFAREESEPFTENQLSLVQAVVDQAALALETQHQVSEAQRRAVQLNTAAEVARATTSVLTEGDLLAQAVALILERLQLYYVGIFLVDDTGRWAVLRAGTGAAGRKMIENQHHLPVDETSMIGACVVAGEAQIAQEFGRGEARAPNPLLPETRSEVALPLFSQGRVIGAMTIQAVQPAAFSEDDITTLQTMADQLANAIENVRLLRQMDENVRALEAAQGAYTSDAWRAYVQQMGARRGYRYRFGIEPTHTQHPEVSTAIDTGQVVVDAALAPEAQESQGVLAVPVRLRGQVVGGLNLRLQDAEVPEETVALVERVADQLAIALENARLYEVAQQRAAEDRLVSTVSARMRESLDINAVLQTAVREIGMALGLHDLTVELAPDKPLE